MKKAFLFLTAVATSATFSNIANAQEKIPPAAPRKVALVVQNYTSDVATLPMAAFADTLTSRLSGGTFRIVNPHNVIGVNQYRSAAGEAMPEMSAKELAASLGADGVITASVQEFSGEDIGVPAIAHQLKVRIAMNLANAATGETICGVDGVELSKNYTVEKVKADTATLYEGLMHAAAAKAAERLVAKVTAAGWEKNAAKPLRVFFGCNVLGADIQIDGLSYGTCPTQLSLTPGVHNVIVSYPPYYNEFRRRVMFNQEGQMFKVVLRLTPEGESQRNRSLEYEAKLLALDKSRLELENIRNDNSVDNEKKKLALERERKLIEFEQKERSELFKKMKNDTSVDNEKKKLALERERKLIEFEQKERSELFKKMKNDTSADNEKKKLALERERKLIEFEQKERSELFKKMKNDTSADNEKKKLALERERKLIEFEQKERSELISKMKNDNAVDYESKKLSLEREKKSIKAEQKERCELFKKQLALADAMLERYSMSGEADDYVRKTIAEGKSVFWKNDSGRIAITDVARDNVQFATPATGTSVMPVASQLGNISLGVKAILENDSSRCAPVAKASQSGETVLKSPIQNNSSPVKTISSNDKMVQESNVDVQQADESPVSVRSKKKKHPANNVVQNVPYSTVTNTVVRADKSQEPSNNKIEQKSNGNVRPIDSRPVIIRKGGSVLVTNIIQNVENPILTNIVNNVVITNIDVRPIITNIVERPIVTNIINKGECPIPPIDDKTGPQEEVLLPDTNIVETPKEQETPSGNSAAIEIENPKGTSLPAVPACGVQPQCRFEDSDFAFIDLSKIEALLKEHIDFDSELLAGGKRANVQQIKEHNNIVKKYVKEYTGEMKGILQRATTMSADKQEQFVWQAVAYVLKRILPYLSKLIDLEKEMKVNRIADVQPLMRTEDLQKILQAAASGNISSIFGTVNQAVARSPSGCNGGIECTCDMPEPSITLPPAGAGWAKCVKCKKMIGTIVIDRDKKCLNVITDNVAAKKAIEQDIKRSGSKYYRDFKVQ